MEICNTIKSWREYKGAAAATAVAACSRESNKSTKNGVIDVSSKEYQKYLLLSLTL